VSKAVTKRWDYDESVTKVKPLVMKWGTLSIEMLGELHKAREVLSRPGTRTDITSGQMSRGWESYCTDVGLEKRTANRWLKMYDPKRHKLLMAPGPENREPSEYEWFLYNIWNISNFIFHWKI